MTNHGAYDFLFLGSDGVLRSFNNATMVVTHAQPLSPREISLYLGGMTVQERHKPYGSQIPLLADNSRADGHKVPVAEWMSPPAAIVTEAALHVIMKKPKELSRSPRILRQFLDTNMRQVTKAFPRPVEWRGMSWDVWICALGPHPGALKY